MRIPSGTTDQYIYFVAVDSTDFTTRETSLSGFDVYRSRNGAAAAQMSSPTINEVSSGNMPGVYELLLDEDMTIAAGNDSEEMVFHITKTGMAPVTRTIELYRPKITAGETLTVSSGNASADIIKVSGDSTAADNLELMYDGTGYAGGTAKLGVDIVSVSGDTTAADNLEAMYDGTGYVGGTAKLTVDVAKISGDATAADNLEATYDGTGYSHSNAPATQGALATTDAVCDGIQTDLSNGTDGLGALKALIDTVDTVCDGIQTDLSNGTDGLGALKALIETTDGICDAIKAVTDNLPNSGSLSSLATASALATTDAVCDGIQTDLSNSTDGLGALKALIDTIDTVVDAVKVKTDQLTFTTSNQVDATTKSLDNDVITAAKIAADAIGASELAADAVTEIVAGVWGAASSSYTSSGTFGKFLDAQVSTVGGGGLTVSAIADGVWDEVLSGHSTSGTAGLLLSQAGGGSGNIAGTITITDGSSPIDGANVDITTGNSSNTDGLVATGTTNVSGQVSFNLSAGTYYQWVQHASYSVSNPTTLTVS
tara:strand:+ start:1747 stop:3372 length:1626 start_codon:yes stop_codon:yes gene_type:complete